jgi:hypothetical protein
MTYKTCVLLLLALSGCAVVVKDEAAVADGDCAYLQGRQKVSCKQAPLVKLLKAVNRGRSRTEKVYYVLDDRVCPLVSGTWDNDARTSAHELVTHYPRIRSYKGTEEYPPGPMLYCRLEGEPD